MTKAFLQRLWNDERGQSTTEYILILAVVVMIAMKFKEKIAGPDGILVKLLDKVGGQMQSFDQPQ